MKKHVLTCAVCAFAFASFATIRIVDNKGSNPKNYTSLQTAIDESAVGDTIYVAGSMNTYGEVTIGKKIVLAGEGLSSVNQRSLVQKLTFNNQLASGSKIFGLTIDDLNVETETLSDLELAYNKVRFYNGSYLYKGTQKHSLLSGATIYNNYWDYLTINISGSVFSNNVVNSQFNLNNYFPTLNGISVSIVANNLFKSYFVNSAPTVETFTNINFQNNIVLVGSGIHIGNPFIINKTATLLQNNLFDDNGIKFSTLDGLVTYNDKAPTGNYLEYLDDIFVEKDKNYHLKASSKGVKAGLDGTDVGIYGGLYPWQDFEGSTNVEQFRSRFAMITGMTMKSNAPSNSTINVELKAKSIK